MDTTTIDSVEGLDKIKKIVVLMFENRSFDHIFGAFPGVNGLLNGNGTLNKDYYNLPNPLQPPSDPTNLKVFPTPIDPRVPLGRDFTHDFGDGMMPDLFGPIFMTSPSPTAPSDNGIYYSGYAKGSPLYQANPGQTTYPPTNSGFYTTYNEAVEQGQAALSYFDQNALKVLPTLAKSFVLCDNWYCDMPGHTLPNRAFIHCGTTGDVGIDDTDEGALCTSATIFDRIDAVSPGNWKMYAPAAMVFDQETVSSHLDTNFLTNAGSSQSGVSITEFKTDCEAGTLPFYSFIMCWLPAGSSTPWTDTTMHPGSMVQPGENLLAAVYNTLRNSPSWDETLLVVTFDENGGIYDHMMPPKTTPPDDRGIVTAGPHIGAWGNLWKLVSQFDFSLLGPRIPALLISPWLKAGIDTHQYQNTSVLRLLIDKLNSATPKTTETPNLTERDKLAPRLDSAFAEFGTDKKRDDCPDWIEPYATLPSVDPNTGSDAIPYSDGMLGVWNPPSNTAQSPPVSYTRELLDMYISPLRGHADTGKPIEETFTTNAAVASYVQERVEAAERFHAS